MHSSQPSARCLTLAALLVLLLCLAAGPGQASTFRARLQAAFDLYKAGPLHYKVFALKQEGDRFDAWYTWGYDDLDAAINDALAKCGQGEHVVGACQVYALGDEVVITLDQAGKNSRKEAYRLAGMRLRQYPQPGQERLVGLGFSGDGRFFVGAVPGTKQSQLFFYDNDTQVWRSTAVVKSRNPLEMGRNFAVTTDGRLHAAALFVQDSLADIGRSLVRIEHRQPATTTEIELQNDAFLNDACGLAFSPDNAELAVCLNAEVESRIERYEVATGKKLGTFDSHGVDGRFDKILAYDAAGKGLLVRGGRYQFDWVLKKKSKEADLVWLFDKTSGETLRRLEFPLAPGVRGPEDVRLAADGTAIMVAEQGGIQLVPLAAGLKPRRFPLTLAPASQVDMSPHGIVAVADATGLRRYTVGRAGLELVDELNTPLQAPWLAFDRHGDVWRLVDGGKIRTVAALTTADLESIAHYDRARDFFAKNDYKEGVAQLKALIKQQPALPLDHTGAEFYFSAAEMPLALWGDYFASHAQEILTKSPMVSRLGLDLQRDPDSGFLFTTLARVAGNSPAFATGLRPGDKITAINGQSISMGSQIQELVGPLPVASQVTVAFVRAGGSGTVQLITEKGFRDPGKAAQLLLALFDYGQVAAEAGHPGLTRQAAVKLRFIAARYPSSFRTDLVEKLAVSLEALALAHEGEVTAAFELLLDKGRPHPFPFRFYNTRVWWPLYAERDKLARYLGVKVDKLAMTLTAKTRQAYQDYPDLDGVMIPALKIPALVR
jgi:hypothetical protein